MADAPDKILEQIQKLLNLAANNPSEAEAASAAAKAQQLCEEWNLSVDFVSEKNVGSGARERNGSGKIWRAECFKYWQRFFKTRLSNP